MILFLLSIFSGALTVLAPCILPLLPIVLGKSLVDGKVNYKKIFIIILSLGISVYLFTIFLKATTLLISIPDFVWRYLSGTIIVFIGLSLLFPKLWSGKLLQKSKQKSEEVLRDGSQRKNIFGDMLIGFSLGPIFTTCSPTYFFILASILPQSFLLGNIYILGYVFGLSILLFFIGVIGQNLIIKLDTINDDSKIYKKIFALVFITTGLLIATGFDKKLQSKLIEYGYFDITKYENILLEKTNPKSSSNENSESKLYQISKINEPEKIYKVLGKAPELTGINEYLNVADNTKLYELLTKNKVVLFEFWTYDCINCRRTIPYLNDWYKKYHKDGFEIVSVHTPEFSYERIKENVEKKSKVYGIEFPIFMDNNYKTWNSWNNRYWPMRYLILSNGNVIYAHAGEGDYENNEKIIQNILNYK